MPERPRKKERRIQRRREMARLDALAMRKEHTRGLRQTLCGLTVGGLSVYSQSYNLHEIELLSSYGKDFLGPIFLAQMGQSLVTAGRVVGLSLPESLTRRPNPFIITALVYSYGFEAAQCYVKQQEGFIEKTGRCDPWDIAAATAGAIVAYKASHWINGETEVPRQPKRS